LFLIGAVLIAGFFAWERRVVSRGREPIVDPRLITGTAGYATGTALATVYFAGFSGIWLVFALFFQDGLHYTPLQSGLAVTPFAVGSAASAVLGGRLIGRFGRRLTVAGLSAVVVGPAATAVVLWQVPAEYAGFAAVLPLLVGGIGGGLVVTPNVTLTLRAVPVRMAGSAGGALQTGQRFGAAVGTAALTGAYYGVLGATGRDYPAAVGVALGGAAAWIALALVIGIVELRRDRPGPPADEDEHARHVAHGHP
jgi:MFS family permease